MNMREQLVFLLTSRTARIVGLCLTILLVLTLTWTPSSTAIHNRLWSPAKAANGTAASEPRYAIATFLAENSSDDEEDGYMISTRVLTYQILHAKETRIRDHNRHKVDWVVLVTDRVTPENQRLLREAGAVVVQVEDFRLSSWINSYEPRWKDVFTKLRLLQMTQYDRVLFIDADSMLLRPMDGIFDELASLEPLQTIRDRRRDDEMPYPDDYIFYSRPDNAFRGSFGHPVPPDPHSKGGDCNTGFWLTKPSEELFNLLVRVASSEGRFDAGMMEQAMLNYVFRRDGPMPWTEADWRWNANFPNAKDVEAGVHSVHEKLWKSGTPELRARWNSIRAEMEAQSSTRNKRAGT